MLAASLRIAPGDAVLVGFAIVSHVVSVSVAGNELLLTVLFRIVVANAVGVRERAESGVSLYKHTLKAGIVTMGARLEAPIRRCVPLRPHPETQLFTGSVSGRWLRLSVCHLPIRIERSA